MRLWYRLLLLIFVAAGLSCNRPDSAFLRITVRDIQQNASTLLVSLVLEGKVSNPISPIAVTSRPSFDFGIQTIGASVGTMVITVAAAGSNFPGGRCILSDGEFVRSDLGTGIVDVTIWLKSTEHFLCVDSFEKPLPAIDSVSPSRISSAGTTDGGLPATLTLRGWGFEPNMKVSFSGIEAKNITFKSTREVLINDVGSLPVGELDLSVQNRHGLITVPSALTVYTKETRPVLVQPDAALPPEQIVDSAALDVDADGRQDVVVLTAQGDLHTFRNGKSGSSLSLAHQSQILSLAAMGISGPASMRVTDMDGDKRSELVLISASGLVLVAPQNGVLAVVQSEPTLGGKDVDVADFDQDGVMDVLRGGSDITIHLGMKGPGFDSMAALRQMLAVESVLAIDLDRDGRLDFVTHSNPGGLAVFTNQNSFFRVTQTRTTLGGCSSQIPGHLISGDLNADGYPELLVNGGSLVFRNDVGVLKPSTLSGLAPCFGGESGVIVDLNHDRFPDIVWLVQPNLIALLGTGLAGQYSATQSFKQSVPAPKGVAAIGPRHLPVVDMDGDGVPDLLVRDHVLLLH